MKRSSIGTLLAISACSFLLWLVSAEAARADSLTFDLNVNGQSSCTGSLCTGTFGTVTLTTSGSNVNVSETLTSLASGAGYYFVSTGAGNALDFNATGTVTGLTSNFSLDPSSPVHASTFGYFTQGIGCSGCGNGGNVAPYTPQSLSFTVDSVTLSSFTQNSKGYYFAADLGDYNGSIVTATGNVGSDGTAPVVPEPASLLLLGTGCAFLAIRKVVA